MCQNAALCGNGLSDVRAVFFVFMSKLFYFNVLEEKGFVKHCGKRRKVPVTSPSHNVFYHFTLHRMTKLRLV